MESPKHPAEGRQMGPGGDEESLEQVGLVI